ncbi:hypothetical protein DM02DRAFT_607885 [Periconia macrospinosa]|uniref:Secreted protein n=1 Tax=Periconia macrospinosa TaxID=97972 RepID=A0A2V1ED58_9PLEO|nr:hypothetical protein DM02DRAFT_607885 [Periconia macrospinosa]
MYCVVVSACVRCVRACVCVLGVPDVREGAGLAEVNLVPAGGLLRHARLSFVFLFFWYCGMLNYGAVRDIKRSVLDL